MRVLSLNNTAISYTECVEKPMLTNGNNVLVKVCYAGICRTDIGIANGTIPAKNGVTLGHEFCGEIVEFANGKHEMDGWCIGNCVSANPMQFGRSGDLMCGKDCDGAFAEYIAVPSRALVGMAKHLLSPLGAFLEPVAAALAPLKYMKEFDGSKICIFGDNRIAVLTLQVCRTMGLKSVELISHLSELKKEYYDCVVETEPQHINAYVEALKPGGMLVLKSRSYTFTHIVPNEIAMKEIRIQGARYGDFKVAAHILAATASGMQNTLNTDALFGNVYELKDYRAAFAEAMLHGSRKIFFRLCVE